MSLSDATQADLLRRLRCAEGHLHGVAAMLERGAEGEAVLGQLLAVQGALRQIILRVIKRELGQCLRVCQPAAEAAQYERALAGIVKLYAAVSARPVSTGAAGQGERLR